MLIEIPFNECFNAVIKCSFCINNSSLALSGYIFIWSLYPQVTFRKRFWSPYEPIKRVLISSGQLIIMSLVIQSLALSCNIIGFHVLALALYQHSTFIISPHFCSPVLVMEAITKPHISNWDLLVVYLRSSIEYSSL